MKTKILSLILSLVMVITIVPKLELNVSADCSTITDEQGIVYKLNSDGTATVCRQDERICGTIVIPLEISGHRVTNIESEAFSECKKNLNSVIIKANLTHLNCAFSGCFNLESLELPDSLKRINNAEFVRCSELRTVGKLPDGIISIGRSAFEGCFKLTLEKIPDGVRAIRSNTFSGCREITKLNLPANLIDIDDNAFTNSFVESLTMPSVENIGNGAFKSCPSLSAINAEEGSGIINFPKNLKFIGREAFFNCYRIQSLNIPASLNEMGEKAFWACSLQNIVISPNSRLEKVDPQCLYYRNPEDGATAHIHCGDNKAEEERLTALLTNGVLPYKLNIINHSC